MKKVLLTAALLLTGTAATFAQNPADWNKGDDVTDALSWKDYSGESNASGAWQNGGGKKRSPHRQSR